MVRTQARIWVGLLLCLLMQVGLLAGIAPAQAQREAQTHHNMMHYSTMPCLQVHVVEQQCVMTHPETESIPHDDKCCHVHVTSTDVPVPAEGQIFVPRPVVRGQSFNMSAQAGFAGSDWLPPFRPPKLLNS